MSALNSTSVLMRISRTLTSLKLAALQDFEPRPCSLPVLLCGSSLSVWVSQLLSQLLDSDVQLHQKAKSRGLLLAL